MNEMNFDEMVRNQQALTRSSEDEDGEVVMTRLTRDVACHILRNADQNFQKIGGWTGQAACEYVNEDGSAVTATQQHTYCALAEIGRVLGVDLTQQATRSIGQLQRELEVLGLPTTQIMTRNDSGMSYAQIADWLAVQPVVDEVKDQPGDAEKWPLP